jgi:hypothetical protein
VTKKRINVGFGTYPELLMANARKIAVNARELLAQGIDPKVQRNTLNEAKRAETEHTFEKVATAWSEPMKDPVTPAYAEDIWRSLTLHVFPDLRAAPLSCFGEHPYSALLYIDGYYLVENQRLSEQETLNKLRAEADCLLR